MPLLLVNGSVGQRSSLKRKSPKRPGRKKKSRNQKPYTLYVLELTDGNWYVGITLNLAVRFMQHTMGDGAKWTKLHKPISIHETRLLTTCSKRKAERYEDKLTLTYALRYGEDKVRGGSWCGVVSPNYPKNK